MVDRINSPTGNMPTRSTRAASRRQTTRHQASRAPSTPTPATPTTNPSATAAGVPASSSQPPDSGSQAKPSTGTGQEQAKTPSAAHHPPSPSPEVTPRKDNPGKPVVLPSVVPPPSDPQPEVEEVEVQRDTPRSPPSDKQGTPQPSRRTPEPAEIIVDAAAASQPSSTPATSAAPAVTGRSIVPRPSEYPDPYANPRSSTRNPVTAEPVKSKNPYEDLYSRNRQLIIDARNRKAAEEAGRGLVASNSTRAAYGSGGYETVQPQGRQGQLVDPYQKPAPAVTAAPTYSSPKRVPAPSADWRREGEFYPSNASELMVFDSHELPFSRYLRAPWEYYPFARLPLREFLSEDVTDLRRDLRLMAGVKHRDTHALHNSWSAYAQLPSCRPMRHFRVPHTLLCDRTFLLHPGDALYVERMNRRLFESHSDQGSVPDLPIVRSRCPIRKGICTPDML